MSLTITTRRPGPCLTCRKTIATGERANYEPKIGCWCLKCPPPSNLGIILARRDRGKPA